MLNRLSLALALFALLVVGCAGNKEKQLVGSWKGEIKLTPEQEKNPMAAMAKQMMSNITLDLKEDKTFLMNMMFAVEGNWALEGETLKLSPTKMAGMTMDKIEEQAKAQAKTNPAMAKQMENNKVNEPMLMTLSADGKTLTTKDKPGQPSQGAMTFTKTK